MSERDEAYEAFVEELMERISNRPDAPPVALSLDGATLSIGNMKANLPSLYHTYSLQSPELKARQIESMVNLFCHGEVDRDEEETLEDVRAHLRPKIWSRATISLDRIEMPFCLVGEHLILSIVYDMPEAIQSVPWSRFNKWGVGFNDALRIAFENLDEASSFMGAHQEGGPGLCSDATYDNYGSARFLTDKPYEHFEIGYPRWAFPAARDACAMCQADQPQHIKFNVELMFEMCENDPKPLPPFPLVDYGGGWVNWQPEPDSEVAAVLARRQFDYLLDLYAEQSHYLRLSADERNDFVLIEGLSRDQATSTDDAPKSLTKWWSSTESLIPKSDYVAFPDEGDYKFAWDDVMEVCGDRLAPAESVYPQRWRTSGGPTAEEIEHLQRMGQR
ncbi:MAG: hypothetical protein ACTHK7_04555 [Aureliella sp.]